MAPGLRGQLNALTGMLKWAVGSVFNQFWTVGKLFNNASIALRKGSQHAADVFDSKTMALAKKYRLAAKNPKASVESGRILGNLKQALISAKAKRIGNSE